MICTWVCIYLCFYAHIQRGLFTHMDLWYKWFDTYVCMNVCTYVSNPGSPCILPYHHDCLTLWQEPQLEPDPVSVSWDVSRLECPEDNVSTLIFIITVIFFLNKITKVPLPEPKRTESVFVLSVWYQYSFFLC